MTTILGGDSPIPSNGFVVSGHGESAAWVVCNLRVGRTVTLKGNEVRCQSVNPADMTPRERLESLSGRFLMALPEGKPQAGKDRDMADDAIRSIRKARASSKEPTADLLEELEKKVGAVENSSTAGK